MLVAFLSLLFELQGPSHEDTDYLPRPRQVTQLDHRSGRLPPSLLDPSLLADGNHHDPSASRTTEQNPVDEQVIVLEDSLAESVKSLNPAPPPPYDGSASAHAAPPKVSLNLNTGY